MPCEGKCECKLHATNGWGMAEVECPMCRKWFCAHCFDNCGHECDWGGGVTDVRVEERVRTKPEGVPA